MSFFAAASRATNLRCRVRRLSTTIAASCPTPSQPSQPPPAPWLPWTNGGGTVHATARVDPSTTVEPSAVVHAGAVVGANCLIRSGAVVGEGVSVDRDTRVGFNTSLEHCRVGARCLLHGGVRVGGDGFGFAVDPADGRVVKKPQALSVVVGDDVEIGANSCVDRGSWRDTVIGDHTKLDNMVQIGHNAVVGGSCILCAHVALGGSSTLGAYVVMGGKSAVKDHVEVCDQVRVAAKAGVIRDIHTPGDYAGFPAVPARQWRRQVALANRGAAERHDRRR